MESQSALAMVSANAQDREPPNCCISTYTYTYTCTNPLILILVFVHIHLCVCVGSERMTEAPEDYSSLVLLHNLCQEIRIRIANAFAKRREGGDDL